MRASIFRIEEAFAGLVRRKRAEAGIKDDDDKPDKAAAAKKLGEILRGRAKK